jgi:hypothetical protein
MLAIEYILFFILTLQGCLDFAVYDAEGGDESHSGQTEVASASASPHLRLRVSGVELSESSPARRPMFVIANYLFDR